MVLFFNAINCMAAENNSSKYYYYYQDEKNIIYYTNKPDSEMYSLLNGGQGAKRPRENAVTAPEDIDARDKDARQARNKNKEDISMRLIFPGFPSKQKINPSAEPDANLVSSGKNNSNEGVSEKSSHPEEPGEVSIAGAIPEEASKTVKMVLSSIKSESLPLSERKQPRDQIRSGDELDQFILNAARRYRLSPSLLKAIIKVESNFNPRAVSEKGATGLMQIMPANYSMLNIEDPFDVRQNIMGGAAYLRKMLDYFDSDLVKGIAAYNAGPGNVEKANGIPDIEETRLYVENVLRYMAQYEER